MTGKSAWSSDMSSCKAGVLCSSVPKLKPWAGRGLTGGVDVVTVLEGRDIERPGFCTSKYALRSASEGGVMVSNAFSMVEMICGLAGFARTSFGFLLLCVRELLPVEALFDRALERSGSD